MIAAPDLPQYFDFIRELSEKGKLPAMTPRTIIVTIVLFVLSGPHRDNGMSHGK
jgi:hypothetical protein